MFVGLVSHQLEIIFRQTVLVNHLLTIGRNLSQKYGNFSRFWYLFMLNRLLFKAKLLIDIWEDLCAISYLNNLTTKND